MRLNTSLFIEGIPKLEIVSEIQSVKIEVMMTHFLEIFPKHLKITK